MNKKYRLRPLDSPKLLRCVVNHLAGNARIVLEGNFDRFDFSLIPSCEGCGNIKPESGKPFMPRVILPLERTTADLILDQLLTEDRFLTDIIAIQIEKDGKIEFMSGDFFHDECISVGEAFPSDFLSELVSKQILRNFYQGNIDKK